MAFNTTPKHQFKIGQRVFVEGKEGFYTVAAAYRVEIWNVYELSGMHDFLIKETRLQPAEPYDAPGGAPRPISQGAPQMERRS